MGNANVHPHPGQPQIAPEPMIETEDQPVWIQAIPSDDKEQLLAWVRDNWAEVKALEKARAVGFNSPLPPQFKSNPKPNSISYAETPSLTSVGQAIPLRKRSKHGLYGRFEHLPSRPERLTTQPRRPRKQRARVMEEGRDDLVLLLAVGIPFVDGRLVLTHRIPDWDIWVL